MADILEQKAFDDTWDEILKIKKLDIWKKFDSKVLLDAATGMKDKALAYLTDEKAWYQYDIATTSWVKATTEPFKKLDTKVLLDAVTGMKDGDLAYVKFEDRWYRYDANALPNPAWVTHLLDDVEVLAAVNQAFGGGTTSNNKITNPTIEWTVTGANAGTVAIIPKFGTGEPEIFVNGVKTVKLRDVR